MKKIVSYSEMDRAGRQYAIKIEIDTEKITEAEALQHCIDNVQMATKGTKDNV